MPKKIKNKSIVIASLILGAFISLQLKVISSENGGMTTSKRGEQLLRQLKSLKEEEKSLNKEIDSTKEEINSYKSSSGIVEKDVENQIKKYEELSGYTDVTGKGIEITIKSSQITYNYDLLLSMINKLNSAQANAISINEQRILSNTYMNIKEDKLYINDTQIKEPIIIKAIGNPETLSSALKIKYGIIWEMENYYDSEVEIKEVDKLKITKGMDNIDL